MLRFSTKHQRNDEPIVARADSTIRTAISLEGSFLPARQIGRSPTKVRRSVMENRSLMMNVARCEQTPFANGLRRLTNQDAIHNHISARRKVGGSKLVFGRNVRGKNIGFALRPTSSPFFKSVRATRTLSRGSSLIILFCIDKLRFWLMFPFVSDVVWARQ